MGGDVFPRREGSLGAFAKRDRDLFCVDSGDITSGKEAGNAGFTTVIDNDVALPVEFDQVAHHGIGRHETELNEDAFDVEGADFAVGADEVEACDEVVTDHLLDFPVAEDLHFGMCERNCGCGGGLKFLRIGYDEVDAPYKRGQRKDCVDGARSGPDDALDPTPPARARTALRRRAPRSPGTER